MNAPYARQEKPRRRSVLLAGASRPQRHGGIVQAIGQSEPHGAAQYVTGSKKPQERIARTTDPARAKTQWAVNPRAGPLQNSCAEANRHDTTIDVHDALGRNIKRRKTSAPPKTRQSPYARFRQVRCIANVMQIARVQKTAVKACARLFT